MLSRPQKSIIDLFKTALVNKNRDDIKTLWEAHPWLALWVSGTPVDLGDEMAADYCIITLSEGVEIFRQSLMCETLYVIEAQKTSSVVKWLAGEEVNFGTSEFSDFRKQTFRELLDFYSDCLPRYSVAEIFGLCLEVRPEFTRELYKGYSKNIGSNSAPELLELTREELKQHFITGLENRRIDIVNSIWQPHAWLKAWVRGREVPLFYAGKQMLPLMTINDVLTLFESALACRATEVVREIWFSDDLLRDWLLMRENVSGMESLPVMTVERVIYYHRKIIACQLPTISEAFMNSEKTGKILQLLYSGVPVKLSQGNEAKEVTVSRRDRIKCFEASLIAKDKGLAKSIYLGNWWLGEWLRGKLILEPGALCDNQLITDNELLRIFNAIIISGSRSLQYSVWNKNRRLMGLVSQLPEKDYISLLLIVMNSSKETVSEFVKLYIRSLTRLSTLRLVQSEVDDENAPHFILLDDQCLAIAQGLLPEPVAQEEKRITVSTRPATPCDIAQFKLVLNKNKAADILKFWHENPTLKDKIKALSFDESVKLLKNVMCSNSLGKGPVISLYLEWIQNKEVVRAVLKGILNSNADQKGYYTINRIEALKTRYDALCKTKNETGVKHRREEPEERRQRVKLSVPVELQTVSDEDLQLSEAPTSSVGNSTSTSSSLSSTGQVQDLLGILPVKEIHFDDNGVTTFVGISDMPSSSPLPAYSFDLFSHTVNYQPDPRNMPPNPDFHDVSAPDNFYESPWKGLFE